MTRNLLFALLGSLATVAVGFGFLPAQPAELTTAWHDVAPVPDDDREFSKWWNDLGNRAWQEKLKHREPLWFTGQLKTQLCADSRRRPERKVR